MGFPGEAASHLSPPGKAVSPSPGGALPATSPPHGLALVAPPRPDFPAPPVPPRDGLGRGGGGGGGGAASSRAVAVCAAATSQPWSGAAVGASAMGSSALDLDKHRLALLAAKSDVVNGRAAASWALFAYEKANELKLLDSGGGGPNELARRFQSKRIMYGLCRLSEPTTGRPRIVLIHWVGEDVPDPDQEACAGHLPAIRAFFQEAHLVLKASRGEEVTQEGLHSRLSSVAPPEQPPPDTACPKKDVGGGPEEEVVGTNYRKTNPGLELLHSQRSAFWAQVEREEEERRQEERQRAQQEERRWERLRMEEERREAAERERRVQEKEQLIQEQRKQQAQQEVEEQRREEARRREQARVLAGTRVGQSWASETVPAAGPGGQQPHRGAFFQRRGRLGSFSSASREPGGAGASPRAGPGQAGPVLPLVRRGSEGQGGAASLTGASCLEGGCPVLVPGGGPPLHLLPTCGQTRGPAEHRPTCHHCCGHMNTPRVSK
ncbi:drebrin-like protein B isoform X1 [Erythrolamprus reginae]|uniref:drebrin-like protein B isoform X1 n=1 Tax=Erythrolamprus reginae TaxID=121349 RepID=UPI00396C4C5F